MYNEHDRETLRLMAQAQADTDSMSCDQMLSRIDGLYGRDGLDAGATDAEVRRELCEQIRRDFESSLSDDGRRERAHWSSVARLSR